MMSRLSWILLPSILMSSGCAARLIPAERPLPGARVLVALQASEHSPSYAALQASYRYVNLSPSVTAHMDDEFLRFIVAESEALPARARNEGLEASPPPRFESANIALRIALETHASSEPLPPPLLEQLRSSGASALILARIQVYAGEWSELQQHTRTGARAIFEYILRFGVAGQFSVYDLSNGQVLEVESFREGTTYRSPRRLPPSPAELGATRDPKVSGLTHELGRRLVERAARRYLPSIE